MLENQSKANSLEALLQNGFTFTVDKRLSGFLSQKKNRTFHVGPIPAGIIGHMNWAFEKLHRPNIDPEGITVDPDTLTFRDTYLSCLIIAIAVVDRWCWIPILSRIVAFYFYYRMSATKAWQVQRMIHTLCNYPDFLRALRLASAARK
jgi:hypothetical protein